MSPPAETRMKMTEALGKPPADPGKTPGPDRDRAIAHLMNGVVTNLAHAVRHLDTIQGPGGADPARLKFNTDHLEDHLAEGVDHARRLQAALVAYYPGVAAELGKLNQAIQPGKALPSPARTFPDGDYLPVVTAERDEPRIAIPLPARPVTEDNYDVVFISPGGPEPA
jgi:hypothetical protein